MLGVVSVENNGQRGHSHALLWAWGVKWQSSNRTSFSWARPNFSCDTDKKQQHSTTLCKNDSKSEPIKANKLCKAPLPRWAYARKKSGSHKTIMATGSGSLANMSCIDWMTMDDLGQVQSPWCTAPMLRHCSRSLTYAAIWEPETQFEESIRALKQTYFNYR